MLAKDLYDFRAVLRQKGRHVRPQRSGTRGPVLRADQAAVVALPRRCVTRLWYQKLEANLTAGGTTSRSRN